VRLPLLSVVAGAVFFAQAQGSTGAGAGSGALPPLEVETGVVHVHGLGVDPGDGLLYAATHSGLFRVPEQGKAARVANRAQDTMGFSIVGPGKFIGSGHPDFREDNPPRLGLIESTDAGTTWTILSLGDDADFHALAFAHGQVYGWDAGSGRFMVSADRNEWETRSTLGLFGFAVDPADAGHIVAATAEGLSESRDGGRTWTPADGPALVTLSWHAAAGLWGAEPGGAVWRRDEAGWERAGTLPGEPQAFLATADSLVAAVHDADGVTGIYRSTDDASTWDLRYRDEQQ